jgi:F0F1-type ATP synthase assembly protein I
MASGSPDLGSRKKGKNISSAYRDLAPFLTLGFQLAATVVVFLLIGHWADHRFGIDPFGKLVGVVLGSIGGFLKFFKTVASLTSNEKQSTVSGKRED